MIRSDQNRREPPRPERRGDALDWDVDGADWPHRETSRFVEAARLRWHVQTMGQGPVLLLAHGTGASTHSWRGLMPLLAERFTVVAPDLPGHGFTQTPPRERLSLPGMAHDLAALCVVLDIKPTIVVGHSAGAAILARMCLDRGTAPAALVSLNGAFLPFGGLASHLFSPAAKMLALNPFAPRLFAWSGRDPAAVARLIRGTGSTIDSQGMDLYGRLVANPVHVAAALAMMANWDLAPLVRDLPRLQQALTLVVGGNDRSIPPDDAFRVRDRVPGATVDYLRGLGHLAHEERPDLVAPLVFRTADAAG